MNAVEIEEVVSELARQPFEAGKFPFVFLVAFGNKTTTIKRLRSGASNSSDLGGVLQRSNIHIKVCTKGEAAATPAALKASPGTVRAKVKAQRDGTDVLLIKVRYPDLPDDTRILSIDSVR